MDNDGIELKYSKYQKGDTNFGSEMMTVKLRYKEPDGDQSRLMSIGVLDRNVRGGERVGKPAFCLGGCAVRDAAQGFTVQGKRELWECGEPGQ